MDMRRVTMITALAAAAASLPTTVLADPPAVSAPLMPAPFIGAPTNDNPATGQFSLNFDDRVRYLGMGAAPEHLSNFDLSRETVRRQARAQQRPSARETAAVDTIFTDFQERLRVVSSASPIKAGLVGVARSH